jgi:glycosyltransferase involved in cell wall biosynthesis
VSKMVSIISPCFNEQDNIRNCQQAVATIFREHLPGYAYEHIFADNSSSDNSLAELRAIAAENPQVRVIVNARNYGPFRSSFNALRTARGDAVLVMLPVDLQDPPELIPEFVRNWEAGFKIVYGQRQKREEGFFLRSMRKFYYRLISRFADIQIPLDTAEFQLIDRQVADAVLRFHDHYPYIRGMIANVGFRDRAKAIPYTWRARARGKSKNRYFHLLDQGLNGIISFTNVPLRLAVILGFCLAVLSLIYAVVQLALNLVLHGAAPPGIATLIVAVFFFSGVQLMFIGVLGEYVSSIHSQVRTGPIVIESERMNFDDNPAAKGSGGSAT